MKKINIQIFVLLLFSINMFCQNPVTSIRDYKSGSRLQLQIGTYCKDVNGDYDFYTGNWVWINNDEKIIFKIKKITQYFLSTNQTFQDVLVADYIYTTNYGMTTIADTSLSSQNSINPNDYPMFATGPSVNNINILDFAFEDVLIPKNNTSNAEAIFTRIPGTTNQMSLVLKNPSGPQLMFPGDPLPNFNFSLPSGISVTKQP